MMTEPENSTREEAIMWAIRLRDPGFDDWEGFSAWLEADPEHAHVHDLVTSVGDLADEVLRAPKAVPLLAPKPAAAIPIRPRRWQVAGGLMAAAIVGALGWGVVNLRPAPYTIETARGEHRLVSIGTATIALNGDTRLVLDRHDPHVATLDHGEALFDVRHDAEHPFTLRVGGGEVQDVGTRFDVTRDDATTRVAVAEGTVLYNPKSEAVRLDAGQVLTAPDHAPTIRIARAATSDIGGWREDRLSYEQAPLGVVAADLSRGLGLPIVAAPDVAAQPFTGVIAYGGDRERFLAGLGPLLDVTVKPGHERWLLTRKADLRQ